MLREITRSTRSTGQQAAATASSAPKDVDALRLTVATLEGRVAELETQLAESTNELKGRIDLIVMELTASRQQQQTAMFQAQIAAAAGMGGELTEHFAV